ncbi:hypothetical protein N7539_009146 [Penicillium diatomitis]|uniref:Uncharacterized protein n=1 Tax=Penicillium diatomitis TaxID=2819901 RepID=A0A9W9WL90_9EURO|nr:uncharacterized protein N7539_009146 [Penicillium diatomitis]KAJ5469528.1 hypothetical protein N7539_009146 [Penicillium diatomitis]
MARLNTQASVTETPAIADEPSHDQPDDTISLDVPVQLLTPENSRSETSSNNEVTVPEEKPAPRRRSTRVTRASLQAPEIPEATTSHIENTAASSSQAYVDSLVESKRTRSSLRNSIAVMERSNDMAPSVGDNMVADYNPQIPHTPCSNSSQEQHTDDNKPSTQQRTLRTRVTKVLAEVVETPQSETPMQNDSQGSMRRSTRLSFVSKPIDLLECTSALLGKRSRELSEKVKEPSRRSSLRPRIAAPPKEESAASIPEPSASKKRRVSESDMSKLDAAEDKVPSEEPAAPSLHLDTNPSDG